MKTYTKEDIEKVLGNDAKRILNLLDSKKDNWEKIESYEDACVLLGYKLEFNVTETTLDVILYRKIQHIIKSINPIGWKADLKKRNFWYLYPRFSGNAVSGSNAGAFFLAVNYAASFVHVFFSSRLWFADKERAEHFKKYFSELINEYYSA